ncbi:hypothetical protein CDAR_472961 [Caerostris darwini]|uniref:Ribosomal protein S10 n=1 Tax=Caerostris darwini TaxID=1538125 RepID=A0AAV4V9W9_9ARAC|nr:hypothetical protein CDAR_472961 [Caerostris darwini]
MFLSPAKPIKSAIHKKDIQKTPITSRAIHIRIFLSTRTYPLKMNGKKEKKGQQQLNTELQYHFCAEKEVAPLFQKTIPPLIARRGSSFKGVDTWVQCQYL